jgi:hypothetical protein
MKSILAEIWEFEGKTRSYPKLDTVEYPTIHYDDWVPVSIIDPNKNNGPWIAGGSVLKWYQSQPVGESDIDVYCSSPMQVERILQSFTDKISFNKRHSSDNAITLEVYKDTNTWTVQIIKKSFYTDMQKVIDGFDISVCQLATDGNEIILGEHTARDIRERNLRMRMPLQPDAAKRMIKYWTYGYRPVDGLLDSVRNNPVGRWEFNPAEDYS